jgi:hypothetical protein
MAGIFSSEGRVIGFGGTGFSVESPLVSFSSDALRILNAVVVSRRIARVRWFISHRSAYPKFVNR